LTLNFLFEIILNKKGENMKLFDVVIVCFLLLFVIAEKSFAQAGLPDPRFVNSGSVTVYLQGSKTAAMDVAVDNSSNIYVSGIAGERDYNDGDFVVLKLFPNGVIDSSFGINGIASVDFGDVSEYGASIAIQNDGKLVVAGTQSIQQHGLIAVTRLNSDGTIDASFGTEGKVLFNPVAFSYFGWIQDMLIQPDGKILMTGYVFNGADKDMLLVRLNSDGSFDSSFGAFEVAFPDDGTIIFNQFYETEEFGNKVLLTQDSGIIVVMKSHVMPAVVKLKSDGSIDSTFGENGSVKFNMRINQFGGKIAGDGFSGALQSDGKILIIGYDDPNNATNKDDFGVFRLNTDGSLDETFGDVGYQYIDYAGGNDWGRDILVDENDRVLLGGDFNVKIISDGDIRMGVARLKSDGTIDNSFDADGMSYSMQGKIGKSMAFSPDSALVIVGTSNNSGFYIAKFLTHSLTTDIEDDRTVSNSFVLNQNYPNPFNPSTTISYSLPVQSEVEIKIYDALGKEVAALVNEIKSAGNYSVRWNASSLSSGVYFYRISAGSYTQTKQMLLMK
jgi:uncharacterized delta-60 repeat protein